MTRALTFREVIVNAIGLGRFRKQVEDATPEHRFWGLQDVNLEVQQGEVVGIIGRNGAGKSTLLKILSRITEPSRGQVVIRGRISSLLEVGTGFHPELTGRENIFLNGAILGMKRREIQAKFDEIVAFAEIDRFLDTPVKRYSSGMYVRLAFAVAANLDPEILLVDEALAVGDAAFQKKCMDKMAKVTASGRTIVFISHNMQAIRSLCHRVVLLESGSVRASGPTDDVIESYLDSTESVTPMDVDATELVRPSLGPTPLARAITRVAIRTSGGASTIRTGGALTVEMDIATSGRLRDVVFGVAIYRYDLCLWESRSVESYEPITALASGRYRLVSRLERVPFSHGWHELHVGIRASKEVVDYLPSVIRFHVEAPITARPVWFEETRSILELPATWNVPESLGPQTTPAIP